MDVDGDSGAVFERQLDVPDVSTPRGRQVALAAGRRLHVYALLFGEGRVTLTGPESPAGMWDRCFDFARLEDALACAEGWDGVGEPAGAIRRRP